MRSIRGSVGVVFVVLASVVFLLSCGQGNPPGVSGFSKGVITAKGSIFVNGVEFDLSGTSITINGTPGTEADLRVGMQVQVKGKIDDGSSTGSAAEVEYDNSLKGRIDAISAPNLTVLGQTVITDTNTVFESLPLGIVSLALNDNVEVAGIPDASGQILATRIEKTGSSTFEISGAVSSLSPTSLVLTPPNSSHPLTVTITAGTLDAGIANGTTVEVKFSTFVNPNISTTASNVEVKAELEPVDGDRVEVQGFVTGLPGSTFVVEGMTIDPGSLSLAGISNGTKVEVEGTFTSGILHAEKIQIK